MRSNQPFRLVPTRVFILLSSIDLKIYQSKTAPKAIKEMPIEENYVTTTLHSAFTSKLEETKKVEQRDNFYLFSKLRIRNKKK